TGPNGARRAPAPVLDPLAASRHQIRRRRLAMLAAVLLVVAVIADAAASGGSRHPSARARAAASLRAGPAAAASVAHAKSAAPNPAATQAAQEAAVARVLAYTPAIVEGGHTGNEVALTFDDGPGPYTPQLVATLDRLHVQGTFFAIGEMERYFSAGTLAELHSGDAIEDHTETHPMLAALTATEQREQLFEQIVRMEVLGAARPLLFRPPYGSFSPTTFKIARSLHLLMVLWSTDTSDYQLPGVPAIVQRALAGAHPGAIILMHDGGGNRAQTIAALPGIVAGLRRRGLRPVTVPQLLLDDPPPPGQPLPTNLSGD
ncbi:MAG: polysaccharide deacetylase family protein, partial [Acidobacteriota bacterium]|nr:polysaccharide deacetylase family protein [Acidobacteriota bacterium]